MLFRYKDHELVKADAYLYLPDTVTFDKNFAKKFEQLFVMPFEIRTCKSPHSFICAFDSNIINRYKDVFSQHKINKQQIIQLEMWDTIQELSLNSITTFGIRTYSKDRVYLFSAEIYKKGHKRACFFYPEFGIFKWMNGNFKGTYNSLPEDVT